MNKVGDSVIVNLPAGKLHGKIFAVKIGYKQLTGETCYEVHGEGFVTVTSARTIRRDLD